MSVAFHRGLTHGLILKLQLAGVRIEQIDAQRALAGLLTREIDQRGNPVKSPENQRAIRSGAAKWVENAVEEVLEDRFRLMREWEEEHPHENPFPPIFPEVVISMLEAPDIDDLAETAKEVVRLARMEMLYG